MSTFSGRFLVRGGTNTTERINHNDKEPSSLSLSSSLILISDVSLSFWGGIDPETGIVIDKSHPLEGVCVTDTILCLPSGRGSCTASQVMLELILNKKAPKTLILRDADGLICVGALVAQSIFPEVQVLDIIQVDDDYTKLLDAQVGYGTILSNGTLVAGREPHIVDEIVTKQLSSQSDNNKGIYHHDNNNTNNNNLQLRDNEIEMINACTTQAERRAMNVLIQYAHITSSEPEYINVEKAHIDGCTYIGPGGLQFVKRLVAEGGKVKIPTTLNSVSTDLCHWNTLGIIPTPSQQASIELANAYLELDCLEQSFTCAPYLLDNPPTQNQQICWGESNAVVYANSVLGARTEKYADYLDICCAIVGKVPLNGVHVEKNRKPTILLNVSNVEFSIQENDNDNIDSFALLFPVLGHLCGTLSDGKVPLLVGMEKYKDYITKDHLKSFCAAFGTTGTSPLIHVAGITPEAQDETILNEWITKCITRTCIITHEQLEETFQSLNYMKNNNPTDTTTTTGTKIDLVALGNPHLSLSECNALAELVAKLPVKEKNDGDNATNNNDVSKKKHDNVRVVACISRVLHNQSTAIKKLRQFGMEFVQDTCWCMLLHPPMIPHDINATILTNSGKYAHYGPGLTGRKFRLGSMEDCINAAYTGVLQQDKVAKLPWKMKSSNNNNNDMMMRSKRRFSTVAGNRISNADTLLFNHENPRLSCRQLMLGNNTMRTIMRRLPIK